MEFETIIMEWKHRKKAKYLTTETSWIIRCSQARRNVGFVFKAIQGAFPMCTGMKESSPIHQAPAASSHHTVLWEIKLFLRHRFLGNNPRNSGLETQVQDLRIYIFNQFFQMRLMPQLVGEGRNTPQCYPVFGVW